MSAIYGIVGDTTPAECERMGRRLRHRGIFGANYLLCEHSVFGGRANSPGTTTFTDDDIMLAADATLYNGDELRSDLEAKGYRFHSDSVAELLFALYRYFGRDCFRHIHGDYAVAIWDDRRQSLILGRDPVGMRPLYYWRGVDRIAFASEYKAILALDDVPVVPDLDMVQYLQHAKYLQADRTLLRDIFSVLPGHWIELSRTHAVSRRYWNIELDPQSESESVHAECVRTDFLRAVERRIADQDVIGINLSGGIDSAAIVAVARRLRPDALIYTFTTGNGPEDPDIQRAASVAEYFNTDHQNIIVKPDHLPDALPQIVWHLEDPIARSELYHTWVAASGVATRVQAVLGGYGCDVLFGGSQKDKLFALMRWCPPLKKAFGEFHSYAAFGVEPTSSMGRLLRFGYFQGERAEPPVPNVLGSTTRPKPYTYGSDLAGQLNQFLLRDLVDDVTHWMPKNERPHMAHAVEVRSPYLDVDLAKTAFRIPARYKLRGLRGKHIFREAARPWMPEAIIERPKVPQRAASDLAFSVIFEDYAREVLSSHAIRSRGFFHVEEVEQLLRRPADQPYAFGQGMRIWSVLTTELWARIFLDERGAPPESLAGQLARDAILIAGAR